MGKANLGGKIAVCRDSLSFPSYLEALAFPYCQPESVEITSADGNLGPLKPNT